MKPQTKMKTNNTAATGSVNIALTKHSIEVLSSGLYSNVALALVRELWINALEVTPDTDNMPVVTPPTVFTPELVVRDYGPGLTAEEVGKYYCTFFGTTKDFTDIGGFGLGCKTPFAMGDVFTIVSYQGGKATSYTIYKAHPETGLPGYVELGTSTTDQPDGLEIKVPIAQDQMSAVADACSLLARYMVYKTAELPPPSPEGIRVLPTPSGAEPDPYHGPVLYRDLPNGVTICMNFPAHQLEWRRKSLSTVDMRDLVKMPLSPRKSSIYKLGGETWSVQPATIMTNLALALSSVSDVELSPGDTVDPQLAYLLLGSVIAVALEVVTTEVEAPELSMAAPYGNFTPTPSRESLKDFSGDMFPTPDFSLDKAFGGLRLQEQVEYLLRDSSEAQRRIQILRRITLAAVEIVRKYLEGPALNSPEELKTNPEAPLVRALSTSHTAHTIDTLVHLVLYTAGLVSREKLEETVAILHVQGYAESGKFGAIPPQAHTFKITYEDNTAPDRFYPAVLTAPFRDETSLLGSVIAHFNPKGTQVASVRAWIPSDYEYHPSALQTIKRSLAGVIRNKASTHSIVVLADDAGLSYLKNTLGMDWVTAEHDFTPKRASHTRRKQAPTTKLRLTTFTPHSWGPVKHYRGKTVVENLAYITTLLVVPDSLFSSMHERKGLVKRFKDILYTDATVGVMPYSAAQVLGVTPETFYTPGKWDKAVRSIPHVAAKHNDFVGGWGLLQARKDPETGVPKVGIIGGVASRRNLLVRLALLLQDLRKQRFHQAESPAITLQDQILVMAALRAQEEHTDTDKVFVSNPSYEVLPRKFGIIGADFKQFIPLVRALDNPHSSEENEQQGAWLHLLASKILKEPGFHAGFTYNGKPVKLSKIATPQES